MDHGKHEKHGNLLFADETFLVQAAVFEVSRQMGTGFLEAVYQECLSIEFAARGIPFIASPSLTVAYKDQVLAQSYRPDFVCFDKVIVELKVVRELAPEHRAQILNYLKRPACGSVSWSTSAARRRRASNASCSD